jgi:hypothetical protein
MADFTSLLLECNTGTQASPTWTNVLGANREIRFHDTSAVSLTTPSASWPFVTRPAAPTNVPYAYAFTADAVGIGVLGNAGAPAAFARANYLQARWNWDATGTFASAPIFTAYPTTAHGAITRGDGSSLGGHATDTGATARSYLKANVYGQVGAPSAQPTNNPAVTDGATGALSPTAGANWLTNFQGLQGDNDWTAFPSTPAAVTTNVWHVMFDHWIGPNITAPATYTVQMSLKYTYA